MTVVGRATGPRAVRTEADGIPLAARWAASRATTWPTRVGVGAVALALALAAWVLVHGSHVDVEVYRRAGARWQAGINPYAVRSELAFTYPPFGVALSGLVSAAPTLALVVLALLSVGSAGAVAAIAAGGRGGISRGRISWGGVPVLLAVALAVASEPVLRSVQLGQVNGLVLALVLVDHLVVPRRWRGWLTGIAGGLKLTPLVFVLIAVVRRDWAVVGRAVGGLSATAVIGAVLVPGASLDYWGRLLFDPARVGAPGFVDNQSVLGAATRLLPDVATPVWLGASAVAVGVAVVALFRLRTVPPVVGILVCGLLAGLVSPISWSHHWLLLPAAGIWCARHGRWWAAALTLPALVVPFVALTGATLPLGTGAWLSNAVVVAGAACLVSIARAAPTVAAPVPAIQGQSHGRPARVLVSATPSPSSRGTV